jgi:hypothetical protein
MEFKDPVVEECLDDILFNIPVLVEHLFVFATEGQYPEAIFNAVYLLQQIGEARLSDEPVVRKCSPPWVPTIKLKDIEFTGPNDITIQTNSTIRFTCTMEVNILNTTTCPGNSLFMQIPPSPDTRGHSQCQGNQQDYPPKWYCVVAPELSDCTISPVKVKVKGTRKLSFKFASPQLPCTFPLKLYVLSDTYQGCDSVSNHVLDIQRKPLPPSKKKKQMDHGDQEDDYFLGWTRTEFVDFIRSLAMGRSIKPAALENIMLSFLKRKAGMDKKHTVATLGTAGRDQVFLPIRW